MDYFRAFSATFTAVGALLGTTSLPHIYHIPGYLNCIHTLYIMLFIRIASWILSGSEVAVRCLDVTLFPRCTRTTTCCRRHRLGRSIR
ncbi:hypothetical protein DFH29DRAFT_590309 [Suillus ampliporus]|nr:hypothetical protein DFH29DRAFT_590309 [Suillus ampliporus]